MKMKSSFFLLNEYRNPICYLLKNVPCNAEEKIGLKRVCHSLSLTGSHSFLEPDDFFFFFFFFQSNLPSKSWETIGFQYWFICDQVIPSLLCFKNSNINRYQTLAHSTSIQPPPCLSSWTREAGKFGPVFPRCSAVRMQACNH